MTKPKPLAQRARTKQSLARGLREARLALLDTERSLKASVDARTRVDAALVASIEETHRAKQESAEWAKENARIRDLLSQGAAVPVALLLHCPACGKRHIDEGLFAKKMHRTHVCLHCGMCWRPATVPTVGVQFLPGCKS